MKTPAAPQWETCLTNRLYFADGMKNAASETKNSRAELQRSSWMSASIPAEDVNKAKTRKDERKRNSSGNQVRGNAMGQIVGKDTGRKTHYVKEPIV